MTKLTAIACVAVSALFHSSSSDQWSAALSPSNGSTVSGTATAEGVGTADSTRVKISIHGAKPNATLPWHIHLGTCSAAGRVLGPAAAYSKLRTTGTGSADALVTLPIRPSKSGSYVVQVHRTAASPAKPGTDVIACGDLRPVLNKMPTN
jgi:hypothetical protein